MIDAEGDPMAKHAWKVIDLASGDRVDLTLDPAARTASAETTASLN